MWEAFKSRETNQAGLVLVGAMAALLVWRAATAAAVAQLTGMATAWLAPSEPDRSTRTFCVDSNWNGPLFQGRCVSLRRYDPRDDQQVIR